MVTKAATCLHIMSYHKGYEWNDGIEAGVEKTLANHCQLKKFYMDTKRNKDVAFISRKASEAKAVIEDLKPDVVIVSDDNASRYLVEPYYRDKDIPFVFCGINWSAEVYGYPYRNATGMVEVAPVEPLLDVIKKNAIGGHKGVFLSSDVLTEHKDYEYFSGFFSKRGILLEGVFVNTIEEWVNAYHAAQDKGFVILGNNAGINNWNVGKAIAAVKKQGKNLTFSNYEWMTPYAMVVISKIPEEQGEWAANTALAILDGINVEDIPVSINRRWKTYVNSGLLKMWGHELDRATLKKAVNVSHRATGQ